ncbi:MAG: hypothetical protein ACYSYL_00275 [Planctomycetota bacterium]
MCLHEWFAVAPMDVLRAECPSCSAVLDFALLHQEARCPCCLRVPDSTVRGQWPCPECGQPRILDEVVHWN